MPSNRPQQAPWDFKCPYKDCCPHLEGLSTQWVFEEYQLSHDEYLEHWKVREIQQEELEKVLENIGKLEKENEELKAKVKALHQRQFKPNRKRNQKSLEDSGNDISSPEKRKKNAVHQRVTLVGIDANPIILIKPLLLNLLRYVPIAPVPI